MNFIAFLSEGVRVRSLDLFEAMGAWYRRVPQTSTLADVFTFNLQTHWLRQYS
jgi:hypothetical protein